MKKVAIAVAAIWSTSLGAALADGVVDPAELTFEDGAVSASLTGQPGDAANGPEIMNKGAGNCIACHAVTALSDIPFHGEVGPTLDGAGSRWSEAELRGIVTNAKMTFDGSVMPAFYKTDGFNRPGDEYTGDAATGPLTPLLTAQQIEDVVAFLMTLQDQ